MLPITVAASSKVGRTPACVKTCNSQDTMSATWRKERSTVETNEIMKTAAHRSEAWCWRKFLSLCRVFWCLSWRSWCAAALRHELFSASQTLRSWVRIPLNAWMSVCIYSVFVLSYVQVAALRRADPSSKESYRLCIGSRNWNSGQGPTKGCRAIDG
jgi:hypothetical protein